MPLPIKYVPDMQREDKNYSSIDYSFLLSQPSSKKTVTASNKDASILFELWAECERAGDDTIKMGSNVKINQRDLMRLKTMGFLTGVGDKLAFTNKGKTVITTMALGEESQFDKKATHKSYTEILASMNKRGKKGFRIASSDPKFATNNTNRLNLKGT